MNLKVVILAVLVLAVVPTASATSFVVPTDENLVAKSAAIVIGTVESSQVQQATNGIVETVFEIRIERTLKGEPRPSDAVRVVSPGGVLSGDRGVIVPAAAKFRPGERVLVFLSRDEAGRWTTTDLTLGRFEFVVSTAGERLLVRDMENVVGWDHAGRVHREKVRRAQSFLRFIQERVQGRTASHDYEVEASEVTLGRDSSSPAIVTNAAYPAATYTDWVSNQPVRWPNISAGVSFYKRSDQNISGAADGGVNAIQNGLAAWTNECGSVINLIYAGQVARASANHDAWNVVEYNDPQSRISGSWGGSGTVAITFISFSGTHTFNGQSWLNITGADVVFQNGYPATNASFPAAMTHELGHGIGFRHSNQNHQTGGACNSAVEECTSAAIMNSSVSGNYGYTLQPYDVNAAQSVYPGGTCGPACTPPSITTQPTSRTITVGQSATLTVAATGTGPLSYQWYIGAAGNTSQPMPGATGPSLSVAPSATTTYWVRVSNACGAASSSAVSVTVQAGAEDARMDFNGDGKSELLWRHATNGQVTMWDLDGPSLLNGAPVATQSDLGWKIQGFGDFNGDGRDDIVWRHAANGAVAIWLMNHRQILGAGVVSTVPLTWAIEAFGDFHGDGKDEIIWRNTTTGQVSMWDMQGLEVVNAGTFTTVSDTRWRIELAADLDADGRDELVWRHMGFGQVAVWKLNGRTITNAATIRTVGDLRWSLAGAGDFDGDGRDDLLWRFTTGWVRMWLMDGMDIVLDNSFVQVAENWQIERTGDFHGDGKDEIIWWNRDTGQVSMWEMEGIRIVSAGTFWRMSDTNWRLQPPGLRPSLTEP